MGYVVNQVSLEKKNSILFNNLCRKQGKRIIILQRGADKYVAEERFRDFTRRIFTYFRCFISAIDLVIIVHSIIISQKIEIEKILN